MAETMKEGSDADLDNGVGNERWLGVEVGVGFAEGRGEAPIALPELGGGEGFAEEGEAGREPERRLTRPPLQLLLPPNGVAAEDEAGQD